MRHTTIHGTIIGIPSAGRADKQFTLDYLERIGVPRERILLSVQTKSDLEEYTAAGICERVLAITYGPAHNAAGNRNNLLNAVEPGAELLMLDDDIREIVRLESAADGAHRAETVDSFPALLRLAEDGFSTARRLGAFAFGINGAHVPKLMKYTVYKQALCGGAVMGIITGQARFNPLYDTKEDYAFCCENIRQTGTFPSLEYYSARVAARHEGGCWEAWNDIQTVRSDAARLCKEYPEIVEMVGPSTTLVRRKRSERG